MTIVTIIEFMEKTCFIEFDMTTPPGSGSDSRDNHVHTVVRDQTNDFGEDLIRRHYEESTHHRDN
jgi:hypothetical protein